MHLLVSMIDLLFRMLYLMNYAEFLLYQPKIAYTIQSVSHSCLDFIGYSLFPHNLKFLTPCEYNMYI